MSDFWRAQIMKAEEILELTGQEIAPDVLTVHPTGNLLHILLEPPPEEFGPIIIPEYIQSMEKMGVGYIIAAGPRAGHEDYASALSGPIGVIRGYLPGTSDSDVNPAEALPALLLGLHVIFGSHTGMPLRVSMMDREFRAAVLVMSAKDIRGVDTNTVSLTRRVQDRLEFEELATKTVDDSKEILKSLE